VRRYLAEFSGTARHRDVAAAVVADPARHHPAHAAGEECARYQKVWTPEGSPLLLESRALTRAVTGRLQARSAIVCVSSWR